MDELMSDLKIQRREVLNLKHLKTEDRENNQPLFENGIGLDSIDALEQIVLLQSRYKIEIANPQEGSKIFQSVKTMAEYIQSHQKA